MAKVSRATATHVEDMGVMDEVYEPGDAYYAPPGHIPVIEAGADIVEFSPTGDHARTMAVLAENLAAAQDA